MLKRFVPLMNRVLVQRVKPEAKTATGIFLPEAQGTSKNTAVVVRSKLDDITEGQTVYVPEYGSAVISLDGEEYHLFRAEDILGKLEN